MTQSDRTSGLVSRRGLLVAAGSLPLASKAMAQEALTASRDLASVLSDSRITVAMPRFAAPPFFSAHDEAERGLDVDMVREVGAALGTEVTFDRSASSFDEAVRQVAEGHADLAICKLSRTLSRGRMILYSRPYTMFHHGLITNRVRFAQFANGRSNADVVREFDGALGVIAHSSFAEFARASFPRASLREFEDWSSMIDAVREEAIDMAYRDDFEIKKLLVDDPSLTVVAGSITLTDRTDTLAFGVHPDAAHLRDFADLFLDLSRNSEVMRTDEVIARYRSGWSL